MANTIDSSLLLSNYQNDTRKTGSDILGKDDFLKILMSQLQNQDPLEPVKDKDFIAQMATFSSLEQMTNINKSIEKLVTNQISDSILRYSEMIEKQIEWTQIDTGQSDESTETSVNGIGIVRSVYQSGQNIMLELENGTVIDSKDIVKVSKPENNE